MMEINDEQEPMVHALKGSGWFKAIATNMAKRVLENAKESGLPDDEIVAMRKRMLAWFKILKAYRDDMNEVRFDEKMGADFKRDILVKMSKNLNGIRISMFGE